MDTNILVVFPYTISICIVSSIIWSITSIISIAVTVSITIRTIIIIVLLLLLIITPSPPIKSLDFRRFDSSRLLILRGGNSHIQRI